MSYIKKAVYFVLFSTLTYTATSQNTKGIAFQDIDFNTALAKAKEEKKLIFIDAYAVWCGPCKMMDKNVFPQVEVGNVYNKHFVSLKIDMEKGEGVTLAQKYGVRAYPSFLFIDADGEVAHRSLGYQTPEQFIALAEVAVDPERQLGSMGKKYDSGNREPEFLSNYITALRDVMDPRASTITAAYLETQKDWGTDNIRELLFQSIDRAEGSYYQYMVQHRGDFITQFGEEAFEEKVFITGMRHMMIMDDFNTAAAGRIFDIAYPEKSEKLQLQFKMDYHRREGDHKAFAETALKYHEAYPMTNSMQLNSIAWHFYEHIDDKKLLKKGVKLSEESVGIWKQYENLDTLAALYFKTGKKKKGIKTANEAIELAKKLGIDAQETQELIAKYTKK
jgi:thioredoxin-related protein